MLSLKKCFYLRTHLFFPFPVFNLGRKSDDLFSGSQNRVLGFHSILCHLNNDLIALFELSLMPVGKQRHFIIGKTVIAGAAFGKIYKSGI